MSRGYSEVVANLYKWHAEKSVALLAYAKMMAAPMLEAHAKANAPWNDISGNARQGLKGGAVVQGKKIIVYIAHSMDYGVYLELCNDGKYAILDPTVDALNEEIFLGYERIMKK